MRTETEINSAKSSGLNRLTRGASTFAMTTSILVALAVPASATLIHSKSHNHVVAHAAALQIPESTIVAYVPKAMPGYAKPGGKIDRLVLPTWLGSPIIAPVMATSGAYSEIRLPMRPNETTTWVKSANLIFSVTPYFIVINTKNTHVQLYKDGKLVVNAPAGVGSDVYPTPTGRFYVTMFAQSDGNGYGPWELMTSAHSLAIQNWSGTGDALISMHGPLFSDAQIGNAGTHISHGCIRLHSLDQLKFQNVSAGTPILIINS